MQNYDLWASAAVLVLLSIPSIRFSLSRPMLQGILKWAFAITVFPLFIVGMILNLYFVETQFPTLFDYFKQARGTRAEKYVVFIMAVPFAVIISFIWYAIVLRVGEIFGMVKQEACPLVDLDLASGSTDHNMPAQLVIIRKDWAGCVNARYILLDGRQLVEIKYRQFVRIDLTEGKHTIGIRKVERSGKHRDSEFEIELQGGRTYFYRIIEEITMATLKQVSAHEGEKTIRNFVPVRCPGRTKLSI